MMIFTSNAWNRKVVTRGGAVRVELRKNFSGGQMLIFVALDGWEKDPTESLDPEAAWRKGQKRQANTYLKLNLEVPAAYAQHKQPPTWLGNYDTHGYQVRLSLNGPAKMTLEEFQEIHDKVAEEIRWLKANA